LTSVRFHVPDAGDPNAVAARFEAELMNKLSPAAAGVAIYPARAAALQAAGGATDFGEYFVYFSFFIVVSALLLVVLFFRLGIEQRARESGLLRGVGFGPAAVRRLFLGEGGVLAAAGSLLGALVAVGYAWLLMAGLRSWWIDAVGTTALTLHVTASSLIAGGLGGMIAAIACIWWTLRSLSAISERRLLAGALSDQSSVVSGFPGRRSAGREGGSRTGGGSGFRRDPLSGSGFCV